MVLLLLLVATSHRTHFQDPAPLITCLRMPHGPGRADNLEGPTGSEDDRDLQEQGVAVGRLLTELTRVPLECE